MFLIWSALSGIVLLAFTFKGWLFCRGILSLRNIALPADRARWPKVSLIVPACNEAETIEQALRSLLKMDYPNLELVVVDDRSTDGTGDIVRAMQVNDSRLTLVTVTSLASGWLGKVHALNEGVLATNGEWILFSDADVHYSSRALRKAITHSENNQFDFLTVLPGIRAHSVFLRSIIAQFMSSAMMALSLRKLHEQQATDCVGGGAFNLIRRSVLERSLGLSWLRLEVLDDTGLALAAKMAGARCDAVAGLGEIELEWYPNFGAFVRGLEKNGFAIFQYSPFILSVYVLFQIFLFLGFTLAPFLSQSFLAIALIGLSLAGYIVSSAFVLRRLVPFSSLVAVTLPFAILIAPLIAIRSAWIFTRDKGIYWRGTFYPKAELIANQRLKLISLAIQGKFRS